MGLLPKRAWRTETLTTQRNTLQEFPKYIFKRHCKKMCCLRLRRKWFWWCLWKSCCILLKRVYWLCMFVVVVVFFLVIILVLQLRENGGISRSGPVRACAQGSQRSHANQIEMQKQRRYTICRQSVESISINRNKRIHLFESQLSFCFSEKSILQISTFSFLVILSAMPSLFPTRLLELRGLRVSLLFLPRALFPSPDVLIAGVRQGFDSELIALFVAPHCCRGLQTFCVLDQSHPLHPANIKTLKRTTNKWLV